MLRIFFEEILFDICIKESAFITGREYVGSYIILQQKIQEPGTNYLMWRQQQQPLNQLRVEDELRVEATTSRGRTVFSSSVYSKRYVITIF